VFWRGVVCGGGVGLGGFGFLGVLYAPNHNILFIDFCLVYFSLMVIFLLNFVGYFYMYNFYYITFVWFLFLVIHNILLLIILINEIYYHLIIIIICLFISFFTPLLVLKSLYMRVYAIICLVFGLE